MFAIWHRRLRGRSPRQRGLAAAVIDAVVAAGMFAFMESWVVPLAVTRLGASDLAIAVLAALPMLFMAGLSLGAQPLIRLFGGDRRAAVGCTLIQTASLAGLFFAIHARPGSAWPVPLLIGLVTVMGAAGAFGSPAYQSLLAGIIPRRILGRYLSGRLQLFLVAKVLLGAGFAGIMHLTGTVNALGFSLILGLAIVLRLVSAGLQLLIPDTPRTTLGPAGVAPCARGELAAFLRSGLGRGTIIWVLLLTGVGVAGPFFVPFMLATHPAGLDLARHPFFYWILLQTSQVVRLLALPVVGRLVDTFGGSALLRVALWGIVLVPLPWALASGWWWIVVTEVGSGLCWCIAEAAMSVLLIDCSDDPARRTRFIGLHQFIVGVSQTGSNLAGGALLGSLPLLGGSSYRSIFILSTLLRAPAAVLGMVLLPSLRLWTSAGQRSLWRVLQASLPPFGPPRGPGRFLRRP